MQPQSQGVQSGQTATLSVAATGKTPLVYQWYQRIAGETTYPVSGNTASFTTPVLTTTTPHWVRIGNACAQTDSITTAITGVGSGLGRVVTGIESGLRNQLSAYIP